MSNVIKSTQVKSGKKVKLDNSKLELKQESESVSDEAKERSEEIVKQAKTKADQIIKAAKEEAATIKENVEQEIKAEKKEILEEAKEKGFQKGLSQGQEEGKKEGKQNIKQEFSTIINQLEAEVNDFHQQIQERKNNIRTDVIKLSIAISEKIIEQQLEVDKTVLKNMVRAKLKKLEEGENLKLRIRPDNLQAIKSIKEELDLENGYIEEIKLIADEKIMDDGVIIETDFGGLDATVSTQLNKIKDELLEVNHNE